MSSTEKLGMILEALCASTQFYDWQQRLTESFYDKEEKGRLIEEVKEVTLKHAHDSGLNEVEALQGAIIKRLIGLASQNAKRPKSDEASALVRTQEDVEDLVIESFPYPIAICYRRLTEAETGGAGAFGCLLDTFESLLHYLATFILSSYWHDGAFEPQHNKRLIEKLYKGKWGAGDLIEILRETTKLYLNNSGALMYPELVRYLFSSGGVPSASLKVLEGFVEVRNRAWGHGAGRDDRFYSGIFKQNRQRLEEELNRCDWLVNNTLWVPKQIDDEGYIRIADLLNGDRRRKDRPVSLQINVKDLAVNGGDILLEETVLLVNQATGFYLPLFPLSRFHYQQAGQGLFFLSDLDWSGGTKKLKKVRYITYDSSLADYDSRIGDLAVSSLELKIHQLARLVEAPNAPAHTKKSPTYESENYNLPEVWVEQASHLSTFAGRANWLAQIEEWSNSSSTGNYLLLLGPPGQGKSALLAQFAYRTGLSTFRKQETHKREQAEVACLLHMVKSHKNARRFLQFLIYQAEQLLGATLGETLYQGNIEDLRNILVGLLEKLRQKYERILVVIDALDELDVSGNRIQFLPENLPDGIQILLSCRPDIPLVKALQHRLEKLTIKNLPPLGPEDLPPFLERYLDPSDITDLRQKIDFKSLFRRTDGNPLFLKRAMERILDEVRQARKKNLPVPIIDVDTFPNTVDAVFEDIYCEISEKYGGANTNNIGRVKARLIQMLSIALEPLSISDLRGLLRIDESLTSVVYKNEGREPGWKFSLEETRDAVWQMSEYLLSYDGERFLPFHQGFADYLHRTVMGRDGVAAGHRIYCLWSSLPPQSKSLYRLRHLPAHLQYYAKLSTDEGDEVEANQALAELTKLLSDFGFIQEKVHAGLIFDLIRDYRSVISLAQRTSLNVIETWYKFIDSNSHILTSNPHLFLQQALNQPRGSAVSKAAEAFLQADNRYIGSRSYLRWLNKPVEELETPLVRTLTGHTKTISDIVITPDGRRVVSAGWDKTLRIWELSSGQCVSSIEGHTEQITVVAITPDGKYIISGGWDKSLKIFDLSTEECLGTLEGHEGVVTAVELIQFNSSNQLMVSGSNQGGIRLWDLAEQKCLSTLNGHSKDVTKIIHIPNSRHLITSSKDGTIKFWDFHSGNCLKLLQAHKGSVNAIRLSPDNRRLVSVGRDKKINIWDPLSGEQIDSFEANVTNVKDVVFSSQGKHLILGGKDSLEIWDLDSKQVLTKLEGHTGSVSSLALTQEETLLVSGSADGTIKVWDLGTNKSSGSRQTVFDGNIAVAITPDEKKAISGGWHKKIYIWDLSNGKCISILDGHTGNVMAIAVTPDGKHAISGGDDKTLRIWDLSSGLCIKTLEGHKETVMTIKVTSNGKYVISGGFDKTIQIWKFPDDHHMTLECDGGILDIVVMPDDRQIVSCSTSDTVSIWDLESGKETVLLKGHLASSLALTPDSREIVLGCKDGMITVFDLGAKENIVSFKGHEGTIWALAITSDGRRLISGSDDETLKIWDMAEKNNLRTLGGHQKQVFALAITPDSTKIVSGGLGEKLKILEIESGRCHMVLGGYTEPVYAVSFVAGGDHALLGAFSEHSLFDWDIEREQSVVFDGDAKNMSALSVTNDGKHVWSGTIDGIIKMWDPSAHSCLASVKAHADGVTALAFSRDSKLAVSVSADKLVKVWDVETGRCISDLQGHTKRVNCCVLTPDSRMIISGGTDGKLKVWDVNERRCISTFVAHQGGVSTIEFIPEEELIVSGGWDHTIKVWELHTGNCVSIIDAHEGGVTALTVTPNGKRIISGGNDKLIKIWDRNSHICQAMFPLTEQLIGCAVNYRGDILASDFNGHVYLLRHEWIDLEL